MFKSITNGKLINNTPKIKDWNVLGRYKVEFDIECSDFIAESLVRTFRDEIYEFKTLEVALESIKTDDPYVNIDGIQLVLSQINIDQETPLDAVFKVTYMYNLDSSVDTAPPFQLIYSTRIQCTNYPKYSIKYATPISEIALGKYLTISNIVVKPNRSLMDFGLLLTGAVEFWDVPSEGRRLTDKLNDKNNSESTDKLNGRNNSESHTLSYRSNKFHFGIQGYETMNPTKFITAAGKEIIKRLENYKNYIIKMGPPKDSFMIYRFENHTITLMHLIKGAYELMHKPAFISGQEYSYALYKFDLKIDDEDVYNKIIKSIDLLISTLDSINTDLKAIVSLARDVAK